MRRTYVLLGLVGIIGLAGMIAWRAAPTIAQQANEVKDRQGKQPIAPLPIAQVHLFSSGVGYFQREGTVQGDAHVDLSFPATDVNDLLKSLVLEDRGGGHISTITYDSHDPIEKTLRSFALDLTNNPTFGQILNQSRGERVEVTLKPTGKEPARPLTGTVVGMEAKLEPAGEDKASEERAVQEKAVEVEHLNILCADGLHNVALSRIERMKFLNPVLDGEFKRALDVLASGHDTQKKKVRLAFAGNGKRPVRVGYVVENPLWKTSYRLTFDKDGKLALQAWALVENTSDEDWKNVNLSLVSGRPISYQMNLFEPLYIPRPEVELERFASLRPPTYSGALTNADPRAVQGGLGGGLGGLGGGLGGGQVQQGGFQGNRYQNNFSGQGGGGFQGGGFQGGFQGNWMNNNQSQRLTYQQLQERRRQSQDARAKAKEIGSSLAALDPAGSIRSAASAKEMGEIYHYVIDEKVTLPRQKSAMLPLMNKQVEGTRVSIYNESVQAKFPLLGLRFKNTTGLPLMQGPITVYEGGSYAGDARVLDLQPGEVRLLSYAVDLGTEVKTMSQGSARNLVAVKVVKGVLHATHRLRESKIYHVVNRSGHDRALLIEHPVRPGWKLEMPIKPTESSRDYHRFALAVPAGKVAKLEVVEEQTRTDTLAIRSTDDREVCVFLNSQVSSPRLREAMAKAIELKGRLDDARRERVGAAAQLKALTDDQTRVSSHLLKLPPTSAAYKRFVDKIDKQETEIEKLQKEIDKLQAEENKREGSYESYVVGLNVE